jgi:hypothetical protein
LHRADTRSQGAFAVDSFSNDDDGSLKMQTFDNTSQGKVSVVFEASNPATALGTLGDLSQLSVDFFKSSNPATPSDNQFAYRICSIPPARSPWSGRTTTTATPPSPSTPGKPSISLAATSGRVTTAPISTAAPRRSVSASGPAAQASPSTATTFPPSAFR